jgi:hypothetical protein
MDEGHDEQAETWEHVYTKVCEILSRFGTEDPLGHADYLVVEDNYGPREVHVEVHNLKMLAPEIVTLLRNLTKQVQDWQISVAVHVPGTKPHWPVMGLTIRRHEIIDGLQRQFLPEPYRSFHYEDSRPGGEFD